MKALVWHGRYHMQCDTVPDPEIEDENHMIVKVTSTAICGSDLHCSMATRRCWKRAIC